MQETTASLAAAEEISMDAAVLTIISQMDGISASREEPTSTLIIFY